MLKNIILTPSVISALLALSVLAKADFGCPAFAQSITPKTHIDEAIKALKKGDSQGGLMQLVAYGNQSSYTSQITRWMYGFGLCTT
jgi:hypothetical protein